MYIIAICDPDRSAADTLRISIHNVLDNLKIAHMIYYYKDSEALYKILKKYPEKYNLLFLEADPSSSSPPGGIALAKRIRKDGFTGNIAFTAATDTHVFEGYEVDACQYFLKPVDENRLHSLFFRLSVKSIQQHSQYLRLNVGTTHHKIRYLDITYIETASRKVAIHTQSQTVYYPCKLSEMEELLPCEIFIRCHQSFIVQLAAVDFITKTQIFLKNGAEVPLSRSYRDSVCQAFRK